MWSGAPGTRSGRAGTRQALHSTDTDSGLWAAHRLPRVAETFRIGPLPEEAPPSVWKGLHKREDDCGCNKGSEPTSPTKVSKPAGHVQGRARKVSGDWLANVLDLDMETAQSISGQQVEVEPLAWAALRAANRAPAAHRVLRSRLKKRREAVFPAGGKQSLGAEAAADGALRGLVGAPLRTRPPPDETYTACATSDILINTSARYVDSTDGDDEATGGLSIRTDGSLHHGPVTLILTVRPWKTLRRVERWLESEVYRFHSASSTAVAGAQIFLLCGRVWNGTEEAAATGLSTALTYKPDWASLTTATAGAYGERSILTIPNFKATATSPLTIKAYGSGDPPKIDGTIDSAGASAAPQYGDNRVGILFYNCCHVSVSDIDIRGFNMGIEVRGGSKDHTYSNLTVYDHATYGVRIGVNEWDVALDGGTYATVDTTIVATDLFPEDITITDCRFYSIGYDTQGGDISLGFLATSCTISSNTMYGDETRGIDGIVSQGGSSGHDIDGNKIYTHSKYCYANSSHKTVLATPPVVSAATSAAPGLASCATASVTVLLHQCDKDTDYASDCATPSGFGYSPYYYSDASTTTDTSATIEAVDAADTEDAFGEDGIDLKGVRDRTGDGTAVTVVRNNIIYGHPNHAGITINDGSNNIHIYNNRIYANGVGILVTNSPNSGAWWTNEPTSNIFIYRNLIYLNAEYGVQLASYLDDQTSESGTVTSTTYKVSGVYVANNTIAHNYLTGLRVTIDNGDEDVGAVRGSVGDVDFIYLYNNLFARNGIGGSDDTSLLDADWKTADAMQVAWDSRIDLAGTTTTFDSDNNVYLGWEHREFSIGVLVIKSSDARSVLGAQEDWGIEGDGVQASSLSDLGLEDPGTISTDVEGTKGQDLRTNMINYMAAGGVADIVGLAELLLSDTSTTAAISAYSILLDTSVLVNAGRTGTLVNHHEYPTTDVALSPDIMLAPIVDGSPDVGAYEGPEMAEDDDASMLHSFSKWADHV